MAFVIKNSNMYFTQIVDHSSMAAWPDIWTENIQLKHLNLNRTKMKR